MVFERNSPHSRLDGEVGVREELKVLESAWVQIPLSSCVLRLGRKSRWWKSPFHYVFSYEVLLTKTWS